MMLKKKAAAVLTALSIFFTWLLPVPALASAEYVPQETSCRTLTERLKAQQTSRNVAADAAGRPYKKQYYYEQLDGPSKAVYNAILSSALGRGPSTNRLSIDLSAVPASERTIIASFAVRKAPYGSEDEVNSPECSQFCADTVDPALTALMFDHSELSWLRNTEYSCAMSWNGRVTYNLAGMQPGETRVFNNYTLVVTSLEFEITATGYAWATLSCDTQSGPDKYNHANTEDLARIQQALGGAIAQIGDLSGLSVPDRIKAIHDWVCTHMEYADKSSARFINEWRGYQTAYSALVEGTTVCAGYCAAFKLLCDAYDIPCVIVRGLDGENSAHVWNYVLVDGQWYGVDCTWDDMGDVPAWDFFLRGSDSFLAVGTPGYHEEGLLFDPYPFAYPVLSLVDYARGDAAQEQSQTPAETLSASAVVTPEPVPTSTIAPAGTPEPVPSPTAVPTSTPEPAVPSESASPAAASSMDSSFWPPLRAAADAWIAFELQDEPDGACLTGISATDAAELEHLISSMDVPNGMELRIVQADGTSTQPHTPVSTGQRVQVCGGDGTLIWTATIAVRGDVIGTGRLSLTQLVQMGRQLTQHEVLEGPYLLAADLTGDGKFSISDLVMEAAALAQLW